ncbi:uncharacterized protein EV420DRAFT_1487288 [Desarmillaria tabescens]|uniref:Uncharacterized protein n=1 Tax=Armillaria tabescens TaxID=1929756 RepID=A0AA39J6L9_ARMTA|nr:uncharacterized protein EV420DRAFT_1487288 [Desarmillaria tabescens]KAK0437110.1 hypothetical protein EV420DRAFT_1487288 [Desarmillaria tabescens]
MEIRRGPCANGSVRGFFPSSFLASDTKNIRPPYEMEEDGPYVIPEQQPVPANGESFNGFENEDLGGGWGKTAASEDTTSGRSGRGGGEGDEFGCPGLWFAQQMRMKAGVALEPSTRLTDHRADADDEVAGGLRMTWIWLSYFAYAIEVGVFKRSPAFQLYDSILEGSSFRVRSSALRRWTSANLSKILASDLGSALSLALVNNALLGVHFGHWSREPWRVSDTGDLVKVVSGRGEPAGGGSVGVACVVLEIGFIAGIRLVAGEDVDFESVCPYDMESSHVIKLRINLITIDPS